MKLEIHRPVEVQRDEAGDLMLQPGDETGILNLIPGVLTETAFQVRKLHVHRMGTALGVGSSAESMHTGLIRVTGPNDAEYAAETVRYQEAGELIPWRPV